MNRLKKKNSTQDLSVESDNSNAKEIKAFMDGFIKKPGSEEEYARMFLSGLAKKMEIVQAVFLKSIIENKKQLLVFLQGFACPKREMDDYRFEEGEGFPGQVLKDKKTLFIENVPEDYLSIKTGLGEARPNNLAILPVFVKNDLYGVIEIASFHSFTKEQKYFLEELCRSVDLEIIKRDKNEKQANK